MSENTKHHAGFVNIIGFPNSGKSTLVNALIGEKLSIISPKPQTTRHRIFAIHNEQDYQIIFSDSPGFVQEVSYKMHEKMNAFIEASFKDADLILLVVDPTDNQNVWNEHLLNLLSSSKYPICLIINKTDLAHQEQIDQFQTKWQKHIVFDKIFKLSAKEKQGTDELLDYCKSMMPLHPAYYPKDEISDKSLRFFVSEMIREAIFHLYQQEIPYSTEVLVNSYKEDTDIVRIAAEIFVERKTQKSILIGKGGSNIKKLGIQSRKEIEKFVGKKVFLELFVKVKENWRKNNALLDQLGYKS